MANITKLVDETMTQEAWDAWKQTPSPTKGGERKGRGLAADVWAGEVADQKKLTGEDRTNFIAGVKAKFSPSPSGGNTKKKNRKGKKEDTAKGGRNLDMMAILAQFLPPEVKALTDRISNLEESIVFNQQKAADFRDGIVACEAAITQAEEDLAKAHEELNSFKKKESTPQEGTEKPSKPKAKAK